MKTKEEVVNGIISRFGSEVEHVYNSGFQAGLLKGTATLATEKERSFQEGYDRCLSENDFDTPCPSCSREEYERGLNDAWEAARKIFSEMNIDEVVDIFGGKAAADNRTFFMLFSAQEAIEKLRIYEAQNPNNAQKFVEVFGFMPGFSLTEDGEPVLPALDCRWWDAPYKEPEK